MATGEDLLDDIGCEKSEWKDPADVPLIDAMAFGELTDRPNFATPDLSEPNSALSNGYDQMRVGSRRPFPFVASISRSISALVIGRFMIGLPCVFR